MTQLVWGTLSSLQGSHKLLFYSYNHSLLTTPSLTPGRQQSFHVYCFVISSMLYTWNHTVCNILEPDFSLCTVFWRFTVHIFLLMNSVLWYGCIIDCFFPGLLRYNWYTTLCKSTMYSMMIYYRYTLRSDYHSKVSYILHLIYLPFIVVAVVIMMKTFKIYFSATFKYTIQHY